MSLWNQYEGFSKLAKKFGGPNSLILTVIVTTTTVAAAIAVPVTKHIEKKKRIKEKNEVKLSSLKNYKCGEAAFKQGDIITVGPIHNDIALIKINDSDDPLYVSYSELLKITKKMEVK